MGGFTLPIVFGTAALVSVVFGFCRPLGLFRHSGLAAGLALILPFAVAFLVGPFLGSGAGLGVALILYVVSAFVITLAVFASLGAGLRYGWNALG